MAQLHIIKASAGSGKTYELVQNYLSLIFSQDPNYFKKILAVTFTNKATFEMKTRILIELFKIASDQESDYISFLCEELHKSADAVRSKAKILLQVILHGYHWFRIETIDTFFQGIIRSFTKELHLPGQYNVELDTKKVLNESIDLFFNQLNERTETVNWLMDMVESKIDNGEGWNIRNELIKLGEQLFNEKYQLSSENIERILRDTENLKTYKSDLHKIINRFDSDIKELGTKALKLIEENHFDASDFYYSKSGPFGYFKKLANGNADPENLLNTYVLKVFSGEKDWAGSKTADKLRINDFAKKNLAPLLNQSVEYIETNRPDYCTAKTIVKNLGSLGVLLQIAEVLQNYLDEKNLFLISNAALFIHKIIDRNDTPFIYEKTGNYFNHYMIDEFQDTSILQWENFKPLISNGLSMNNMSLLVGDVKQSIYRWRNSNWEILASQVTNDFLPDFINNKSLNKNWRSSKSIILFNNAVFQSIPYFIENSLWSRNFPDKLKNHFRLPAIAEIYKDVIQLIPEKEIKDEGYVYSRFFSAERKSDTEEYYKDDFINSINKLLNNNYKPGQIAVLVRSGRQGKQIANNIIDWNKQHLFYREVGVISNDSLYLNGSAVVRAITNLLYYLADQKDLVHLAGFVAELDTLRNNSDSDIEIDFPLGRWNPEDIDNFLFTGFKEFINELTRLPLYELVIRIINQFQLNKYKSELVYMHSFLDLIDDYSTDSSAQVSSFIEFWEESGINKTISVSSDQNAIQVITIHKAKGLEFPAVIIPFCDWNVLPKPGSILWVDPVDEPFNAISPVPVDYGKMMAASHFSLDYYSEQYRALVDNLNLLYVAFTRAESALITFSLESRGDHSIESLYRNVIEELLRDKTFSDTRWNEENSVFEYGALSPCKKVLADTQIQYMDSSKIRSVLPSVNLSTQARELLGELSGNIQDPASRGTIWHAILQKIIAKEDVYTVVNTAIEQGFITKDEGDTMKEKIQSSFKISQVADWFGNNYQVLTEAEILLKNKGSRRPDRIMLRDNKAIIVDYKFGKGNKQNEYEKQMNNYMDLLSEMGYQDIEGYIWYVHLAEIIKVTKST